MVDASPANNTHTILHVRDVTVSFDGFRALDSLDFSMSRGELRFVIGPNGAGKTTLLDVITGKTRPQKGSVIFDSSVDVLHASEYILVREGIGRKFQTPTIFGSLTVYENLETAAGFHDGMITLFSDLATTDMQRIQATLELIGLQDKPKYGPGLWPMVKSSGWK